MSGVEKEEVVAIGGGHTDRHTMWKKWRTGLLLVGVFAAVSGKTKKPDTLVSEVLRAATGTGLAKQGLPTHASCAGGRGRFLPLTFPAHWVISSMLNQMAPRA